MCQEEGGGDTAKQSGASGDAATASGSGPESEFYADAVHPDSSDFAHSRFQNS